jgi:hypothetical protein
MQGFATPRCKLQHEHRILFMQKQWNKICIQSKFLNQIRKCSITNQWKLMKKIDGEKSRCDVPIVFVLCNRKYTSWGFDFVDTIENAFRILFLTKLFQKLSTQDLAEWIAEGWRSEGLDSVKVQTYSMLLDYPDPSDPNLIRENIILNIIAQNCCLFPLLSYLCH